MIDTSMIERLTDSSEAMSFGYMLKKTSSREDIDALVERLEHELKKEQLVEELAARLSWTNGTTATVFEMREVQSFARSVEMRQALLTVLH